MKKLARSGLLALLVVTVFACNGTTSRTDTGGVFLTVNSSSFPFGCAVNAGGPNTGSQCGSFLPIQTLTLTSTNSSPDVNPGNAETIALSTYQVVYRRLDGGTTTPPPLTSRIFGTIAPGGTLTFTNLPVIGADQFNSHPLSDLKLSNGGIDRDTGKTFVQLELQLTFFGKTISGREIASNTAAWTVTVLQQ